MTTQDKSTKSNRKEKLNKALDTLKNVIMGIGRLLVVVSIIYSSTIIWIGTDGIIPKVMTSPAIILASIYVVDSFVIKGSK